MEVDKTMPVDPPAQHDWMWFVSVIAPHAVILVTAILNYRSSRSNSEKLREVQRTLNGKAVERSKPRAYVDRRKTEE